MSTSSLRPLERLEAHRLGDLRGEFLARLQPVIVTGGISDWPAVNCWTDSYLRAAAGRIVLRVKPRADYTEGKSTRETEPSSDVELSELLALISSECPSSESYARESALLKKVKSLRSDVVTPDLFTTTVPHAAPRSGDGGPNVWLGPANTIAQLHWDPEHNIFCQVRGRKYIILVPPEDAPLTYPNTFSIAELAIKPFFHGRGAPLLQSLEKAASGLIQRRTLQRVTEYRRALRRSLTIGELSLLCDYLLEANNCHVDAQSPDMSIHRQFGRARRYHAILDPGDMMFIPYYWHHYVRSLETSISVNWFFLQEYQQMSVSYEWVANILLGHLVP
jgi:lysine-specific demethylase 8